MKRLVTGCLSTFHKAGRMPIVSGWLLIWPWSCLKKRPNDRIHSFQELKESLSQIYQNVTGAAYEPITDKSIKELDHIRLARSFNNLGKQHQAIEECDKALSLKLDSDQKVDVLNIKGLALFYLENYQDSLNCFDLALKIDSESSITWSNRGLALKELNKLEEAIQNYDKAIQLDPDDWGQTGLHWEVCGSCDILSERHLNVSPAPHCMLCREHLNFPAIQRRWRYSDL